MTCPSCSPDNVPQAEDIQFPIPRHLSDDSVAPRIRIPSALPDVPRGDADGETILERLHNFEERMELRWAATEESVRKHEKWTEALVVGLFQELKACSFAKVVLDENEPMYEQERRNEGRQRLAGVSQKENPKSCENPVNVQCDVTRSSSSDHASFREDAKEGIQTVLNSHEVSDFTSQRSHTPTKSPRAAKKASYGPSGVGDLYRKKRTVKHAKAHLESLQQASQEKHRLQKYLQSEANKIKKELQHEKEKRQSTVDSVIVNAALAKEKKRQQRETKPLFARIVRDKHFDAFFGLMILTSAFITGFETEYRARQLDSEVPLAFDILNLIFCAAFLVELMLRIYAYKLVFFYGKDWSWNWFDVVVVLSSVVEEFLKLETQNSGPTTDLTTVRVLRLLRLVRMTRVVRALHFAHELRVMVLSLLGSFRPLLWTCSLLCLLLFVNGVYITQVVNDYRSDPRNVNWLPELEEYYGSVRRAVYSLFQSVSGGVDWKDCAEPLTAISPIFPMYFSAFIVVVVFTFLNVVTGIFVDNAMKMAEHDRDMMIQDEMSRRHAYAAEVEVVFREADSNGDGLLSYEELATHFSDDRVGAWLGTLGIDSQSGHALFELLDEDGQGFVDISEFVQGCFRLKGPARSIDVAIMQFEQRKLLYDLRHALNVVELRILATLQRACSRDQTGALFGSCNIVEDHVEDLTIVPLPLGLTECPQEQELQKMS